MTGVPAIRVEDLYYRYSRNAVDVLSGINLTVAPGRIMGLVGESGSGKSTLGRIIVNERRQSSGVVEIEGRPWDKVRRTADIRRSVQMIFQDPYGSLNPYLTPMQAVVEALRVTQGHRLAVARSGASDLLHQVGLSEEHSHRSPSSLSGGQRQRVVIARALACGPRIIVADEPTSALDVSVQAQILNLLLTLQRDLGLTMVFISHDMAAVNHIADDVAVLQHGRIVETGLVADVLTNPQQEYTQRLLESFAPTAG